MTSGDYVLLIADMDIILKLRAFDFSNHGFHWGKNLDFYINFFTDKKSEVITMSRYILEMNPKLYPDYTRLIPKT